jgi:hypothetical protein
MREDVSIPNACWVNVSIALNAPLTSASRRVVSKLLSSVLRSARRSTDRPRRSMSSRVLPIAQNGANDGPRNPGPGSLYGPWVQM